MIKNIIFDFNGTILNDVKLSFDALNACNIKFLGKYTEISFDYYRNSFSFPVVPYYESLGYDFSKIDGDKLAEFFHMFYGAGWKNCDVFSDFLSAARELKNRGIKIFIITASYRPLIEEQLKYFGIADLFEYVIAIDNKLGGSKIDVAKEYFSKNPIDLSKTIMVGDTYHDVEVSRALNITPVLYTKGHNSVEFLKSKASDVKMISSHTELLDII